MVGRRVMAWLAKPLGLWTLRLLLRSREVVVVGVITHPDDPVANDIQWLATQSAIPVAERAPVGYLATIGLSIGFPRKISPSERVGCQQGVLNLHFAPLPYYRGSGTVRWAITQNEVEYGVSWHWIDDQLDTGRLISTLWFPIPAGASAQQLISITERYTKCWLQQELLDLLATPSLGVDQQVWANAVKCWPQMCTRRSAEWLLAA